jgi:hypothetical protein
MLLFNVWSVDYGVLFCNYSIYPLCALKCSAAHRNFSFHSWLDTHLLAYVHLISIWVQKSPFYLWFVIWTDCADRAMTPCSFLHVINISEEVTAAAYFKYQWIKFARICSVCAVGYRIVKLLTEVPLPIWCAVLHLTGGIEAKPTGLTCLQPWWRRQEFLRKIGKHETTRRHTPQAHSLEPRRDENGEAPVVCL